MAQLEGLWYNISITLMVWFYLLGTVKLKTKMIDLNPSKSFKLLQLRLIVFRGSRI
ncbi:hypothetical protein EX30DRAFT_107804 [Ascodesmis nigricans]|uniref:Uncharacterized protein n=1 Tax=Ascodesmis nigricans TaxID=341454 RepID=A0A4S2MQJ3_9PEZI|nr:hypothetical protein EX30DRAFT_107804 [Ascodesmis nigricans]